MWGGGGGVSPEKKVFKPILSKKKVFKLLWGNLLPIRSFPMSFVLAGHLRRDPHHHFYPIVEKFQNHFTYNKYGGRYPLPRSPEMSPVTKDPGNGRITT